MMQPLDGLESLTIDYERDELRVVTNDGRVATEAGRARRPDGPLDFKRVMFRPADLVLEMVVPGGEELEAEVYADDDQLLRRAGRPVIYLDQNKWVQIACAIHKPDRVPPNELDPTRRLITLARAKEIILPISSGHWIETGPTYGRRREHLATLMVGLSRGWVMRDPLRVAVSELATLFANANREDTDESDVFTLDARELFFESLSEYVPNEPHLPAGVLQILTALVGVQSILAVLLENASTSDPKGVEMARGYATLHQEYSNWLAKEQASRSRGRRLTLDAFVSDLGHTLRDAATVAGFDDARFETWVDERADAELSGLPYLGRRRELMHLRLMNPSDRWIGTDLVDVVYLPCAAQYSDYVVCEKKTGDYLQRVSRDRDGGATVVTSIGDLMEARWSKR